MQKPTATGSQACAVCKYQRRKCTGNCLLASFFPANRQKDFLTTRMFFRVRNVIKLIENLSFQQRAITVKTIVFEANMRAANPVGGCYKYILALKKQIARYQAELDLVNQQLAICKVQSLQQQQTAQKQKQVVGNDEEEEANAAVDDLNLEGFNVFEVDDLYSQGLNCGGWSSFTPVYDVFDYNPVNVELEAAAGKQQALGKEMRPLSAGKRDETEGFDSEANVSSDAGEDINPLL